MAEFPKKDWMQEYNWDMMYGEYFRENRTSVRNNGNDHYCELCNCGMTSPDAFDLHLIGKRHKKSLNRGAECLASERAGSSHQTFEIVQFEKQEDFIPMNLKDVLKTLEGPIVGLDGIKAFDEDFVPQYLCCYCDGHFMIDTIGKHLLSSQHKINCRNHRQVYPENERQYERSESCFKASSSSHKRQYEDYDTCYISGSHQRRRTAEPLALPPAAVANMSSSDEDETQTGITDIDIERDSDMISIEMKLDIMKHMIDIMKIRPNDKELAEKYVELLNDFSTFYLLHKVRQLSPVRFEKLLKEIEKDNSLTFDEFAKKNGHWYFRLD